MATRLGKRFNNMSHQRQQQRRSRDHIQDENERDRIKEIYANVKSIPNYSSKILDFLRTHETSSVHKRIIRRKTISYFPYDLCMADLAFFNGAGMARANNGFKYVLVFIDVFSKMCYVEPMKDKQAMTTLVAFENIFRKIPDLPNYLVTDEGTEFFNFHVQQIFKEKGINHYSIRGRHKASVAERMIQTLKGRIEKYLWEHKTKRYIDVLQSIVNNYNQTPHRSIGMSPTNVNLSNREMVFKKLYKNYSTKTKPRLEIGDIVRIAREKNIFEKGYKRNWSLELYSVVSAQSRGGVDYYKVADEAGNILPRQRYYFELNLVERNVD